MKIFRSLRKTSTGKYLLYAIGEIVLVVIGILIALQINNWNESRKDREQEKLYLTSLKSDIEDSLKELGRVINKTEEVRMAVRGVLEYSKTEKEDIPIALVDSLIQETFGYTIAMTNEGTIQDIKGSGDLKVIRNDSIRRLIGSWEAEFKMIRERENLFKTSFNELRSSIDKVANFYGYSRFNQPLFSEEQRLAILRSNHFQNYFLSIHRDASVLNELYLEKCYRLESILKMLDKD